MKNIRASLVSLVFIASLVAASAHAQTTAPAPAQQPTYDGQCSINIVQGGASFAYGEYLCSGNFYGAVEAELHIEYSPKSYSVVTAASQGFVYNSYYGSSAPSYDWIATSAPESPDYYSRAVLTIRWDTGQLNCGWYGCSTMWTSQTATSPWQ